MAPVTDTRFRLDDALARDLASRFGTPLYVVDEAHFRTRIRQYFAASRAVYPAVEISFASKANSTLALLAIAHSEGCAIDVASEGELRAALTAGVPAFRCHMHGSNKQADELAFALGVGVGQVIVDHFSEIEQLATLFAARSVLEPVESPPTQLLLRLAPGVDPVTHHKISTGQADTKFGFNIADGSAERALLRCLELELPVIGVHCHVGSQLLDSEAQVGGAEALTEFVMAMKREHGWTAELINCGGGLGVRYTDLDDPLDVARYCRDVIGIVVAGLAGSGISPTIGQEPGRSLVAECGVTLYRIGVIKPAPSAEVGTRIYVGVDGGLSDNPRPAMYGSRYTVLPVREAGCEPEGFGHAVHGESRTCRISGKHCETDMLFDDVELPGWVAEGDLLQVLCTGAYNSTMASNYNRYPRPACVLIREGGTAEQVVERESWDQVLAREIMPKDLGP